MRHKILDLLGSILYSIFRAEDNPELTKGKDKLLAVQLETDVKMGKLHLVEDYAEGDYDELLENIIKLIELVVWLLNFFNVFKHAKRKR